MIDEVSSCQGYIIITEEFSILPFTGLKQQLRNIFFRIFFNSVKPDNNTIHLQSELANTMEAGYSKDLGVVPKNRKGSKAKEQAWIGKTILTFRRTEAATSPAPSSGDKKGKNRNFALSEKRPNVSRLRTDEFEQRSGGFG